ncbi:camphor resistance protein CrcB [Leucobacter luti]|uniref:Fluoride-specific ion channel FluC n=1 Tax=Leucobacter luti TaxID=340320 RepID=A0A4R6S064_9MICO|nr:CrcB family protein [Leucobacter luti]TDP92584.1 camphor resistance protein CrcB [Leucobacter luti]
MRTEVTSAAARVTLAGIGLVALGGALGSLARYGVSALIGETGGWPLGTLSVNLLGALLLGLLVEVLPGGGAGSRARLLLGTGILGGFTTYSLLATQLAEQILAGEAWLAGSYAAATLLGGFVASWAGVLLGGGWRRAQEARGARHVDASAGGGVGSRSDTDGGR